MDPRERGGIHCVFPQYKPTSHTGAAFQGTDRKKYSARKITESLGNVTVRGKKNGKSKRGARLSTVCLSMYSITENIYYSQLSSVAILLQPERNGFTSYSTRKRLRFLPLFAIVCRSHPASHVSSSNDQWSSLLFCVHCNLRLRPNIGSVEAFRNILLQKNSSVYTEFDDGSLWVAGSWQTGLFLVLLERYDLWQRLRRRHKRKVMTNLFLSLRPLEIMPRWTTRQLT
jgi:hypothetical protein